MCVLFRPSLTDHSFPFSEIAPDLIVYRYSHEKLIAYLKKKAARLSESGDFDKSRTLERQLAKDGLLDDGKEELLKGESSFVLKASGMLDSIHILQPVV